MSGALQTLYKKLNRDQVSSFLLRGISGTFALNIIGRLLSFLLFVILARLLGVQDFGYYVLAWSWVQLLMVLGKFGSDATASKYLAAYKARKEWSLFQGHLFYGIVKVLLKSVILAVVACGVVWFMHDRLGHTQSLTFWLMMITLPFLTLIHFVQAALRVLGHPVRGIFSNTVLRPAFHMVMMATLFVIGASADAPIAAATGSIAAVLALGIAVFWLMQKLQPLPKSETRNYETREWYGYALYILLIASGDMVFRQTDTIMLGALLGAEEAGLYGAILVGLFAALFGGTPTLISEPTGPMTVIMTAVLTHLVASNPDQGVAMAFTVVMIAGVFQILLGVLNLGKYISLMPYRVI